MEKRVEFGERFIALIIDVIMTFIIIKIYGAMVLSNLFPELYGGGLMTLWNADVLAGDALIGPILAGISLLMEIIMGQTPGKFFLRIRIAKEDGTKGDITDFAKRSAIKYGAILLYSLSEVISSEIFRTIALFYSLIIFLGCFRALGNDRQTLHDRLSKTAIFKIEDLENNELID